MSSKRHSELLVGDVMASEPVTAAPGDSVDGVESEMERSDVRHLPVVKDGVVVGIVSDRDLHWADGNTTVAEIMSEDVMTVTAETRLCEASAVMLDHRISALPVVDRTGTLVGIITVTDFVRIAHEVCGGAALSVEDA